MREVTREGGKGRRETVCIRVHAHVEAGDRGCPCALRERGGGGGLTSSRPPTQIRGRQGGPESPPPLSARAYCCRGLLPTAPSAARAAEPHWHKAHSATSGSCRFVSGMHSGRSTPWACVAAPAPDAVCRARLEARTCCANTRATSGAAARAHRGHGASLLTQFGARLDSYYGDPRDLRRAGRRGALERAACSAGGRGRSRGRGAVAHCPILGASPSRSLASSSPRAARSSCGSKASRRSSAPQVAIVAGALLPGA